MLTFAGKFIYKNQKPRTELEHIINESASQLLNQTFIIVTLVVFSLSLSLIGPMYVLVFYGEYAIPTGHVMPFVEADTLRGYIINMIAQMFVGACAFISVLTIEIAGCVINNTYKTMANIVCYNMRKFSDHLRHGTFSYANEVEFRNILVQLQDLEAYIRELNKLFYWKFFLQPILTTGCVSLAIFAQLMVDRLFFN